MYIHKIIRQWLLGPVHRAHRRFIGPREPPPHTPDYFDRHGSNELDSASSTRKVQPCHPERSEGSRSQCAPYFSKRLDAVCHPERSEGSRCQCAPYFSKRLDAVCHPERSEGSRSPIF